jgi:hypothetical protein
VHVNVADKYLLLANSHDGKGSVQIKFSSFRVVCQNTLTLAFSGGESFRLIHTPDVKHRLKPAGQLLAQVRSATAPWRKPCKPRPGFRSMPANSRNT